MVVLGANIRTMNDELIILVIIRVVIITDIVIIWLSLSVSSLLIYCNHYSDYGDGIGINAFPTVKITIIITSAT